MLVTVPGLWVMLLLNPATGATRSPEDPNSGCGSLSAAVTQDAFCEQSIAGLQLLQHKQSNSKRQDAPNSRLQFVHVPCTFGHTVEADGLGGMGENNSKAPSILESFKASEVGDEQKAFEVMEANKISGGELWGMMNPELRGISSVTGCDFYYTPPKLFPADMLERVYKGTVPFGMLRDPYDRMANEFRMQVSGYDSAFSNTTRADISKREGNLEREEATYLQYYRDCDVNGYLQAELGKVLAGDKYRDNCHLVPQAEYYENPYGPVVPVDERKIPNSYNAFIESYGYPKDMNMGATMHNVVCNDISAYSLNQETRNLIKQVYKADFQLLCKSFGYCDVDEMTCLEQIPDMCGGKP